MKLEGVIIVVADLGELKIYRVKRHEAIKDNQLKISYSLELLNDLDYILSHKKLSEIVTDKAGNFNGDTGEEHNLIQENEKRVLKIIAQDIDNLVKNENPKEIFLSFPKEHINSLKELLDKKTIEKITKIVESNLVKTDKNEILSYFGV
jgi:tRNA G18 (ribose-2'-O)-methylase SpoU